MGFLGDLIDDVLATPGKVLRKVARETEEAACAVLGGGHEWSAWWLGADMKLRRTCANCGAEETR